MGMYAHRLEASFKRREVMIYLRGFTLFTTMFLMVWASHNQWPARSAIVSGLGTALFIMLLDIDS